MKLIIKSLKKIGYTLKNYGYAIWLGLVFSHYNIHMSWEHFIIICITVILIEWEYYNA